jgi:hypothetical protein
MHGRVLAAASAAVFLVIFGASAHGEATAPPRGKHRDWYFVDRTGVGHFGDMVVAAELRPRLEPYRGKLVKIDISKTYRMFSVAPFEIEEFASVVALPPPPMSIRLWSQPSTDEPGSVEVYCTVTKAKDFPAGDDSGPRLDVWWAGYRKSTEPAGNAQPAKWFRGEYCFVQNSPARWIGGTSVDRGTAMPPGESMTYLLEKLSGLTGACDVGVRVSFRRETGEPIVGKARMPIDFRTWRSSSPNQTR